MHKHEINEHFISTTCLLLNQNRLFSNLLPVKIIVYLQVFLDNVRAAPSKYLLYFLFLYVFTSFYFTDSTAQANKACKRFRKKK